MVLRFQIVINHTNLIFLVHLQSPAHLIAMFVSVNIDRGPIVQLLRERRWPCIQQHVLMGRFFSAQPLRNHLLQCPLLRSKMACGCFHTPQKRGCSRVGDLSMKSVSQKLGHWPLFSHVARCRFKEHWQCRL